MMTKRPTTRVTKYVVRAYDGAGDLYLTAQRDADGVPVLRLRGAQVFATLDEAKAAVAEAAELGCTARLTWVAFTK